MGSRKDGEGCALHHLGARASLTPPWGLPVWHPGGGLGGLAGGRAPPGQGGHPPSCWPGERGFSTGAHAEGAQGCLGAARAVPTGVTGRTCSALWLAAVLPGPQPCGGAPAARSAPLSCGSEASTCRAPQGGNPPGHSAGNGVTGRDINLPSARGSARLLGLDGRGEHSGHAEGLAVWTAGRGGVAQCKGWGAGWGGHPPTRPTAHSSSCLSHPGSRCSPLPVLARLPPMASPACPTAFPACPMVSPACATARWVRSLPAPWPAAAPLACAVCVSVGLCVRVQRATCVHVCAPDTIRVRACVCSTVRACVCAYVHKCVCECRWVPHTICVCPTQCACTCVCIPVCARGGVRMGVRAWVCPIVCVCSCVGARVGACVPCSVRVCMHVPHTVLRGHGRICWGFPQRDAGVGGGRSSEPGKGRAAPAAG